jgi:hypothetical protein
VQAAAQPHLGHRPTPNMTGPWAARARIGKLTPDGEDEWWRITPDVDAAAVGDDAG